MWRFLITTLPPHIRAEYAVEVEEHLQWLVESQRKRMGAVRFWLFVWGDFLRVALHGRPALWRIGAAAGVGLLAASALMDGEPRVVTDIGPALGQVEEVLLLLAPAENPADLAELSDHVGPTLRDSVILVVTASQDGPGWAAVGTHVRLGQSLGCTFTSRSQLSVTTPGGLVNDGSGQVLCDIDDVEG